jgi:hypothetical protein
LKLVPPLRVLAGPSTACGDAESHTSGAVVEAAFFSAGSDTYRSSSSQSSGEDPAPLMRSTSTEYAPALLQVYVPGPALREAQAVIGRGLSVGPNRAAPASPEKHLWPSGSCMDTLMPSEYTAFVPALGTAVTDT